MGGSVFRVTDPGAPRRVVDPAIGEVANQLADDVRQRTPVQTGALQAGWQVSHGHEPAVWALTNDVDYARFVEYGTINQPAEPMLGPALARARP